MNVLFHITSKKKEKMDAKRNKIILQMWNFSLPLRIFFIKSSSFFPQLFLSHFSAVSVCVFFLC